MRSCGSVLVGMALLTAFKNSGGEIDLQKSLIEMNSRGRSVPGGACGFWGACGAGISAGMFVSIITGATPLGKDNFGFAAKGGNNNEPHNHNDIGHFIVYKNGDEFFTDLGSGEYSRQYFGKERYTFAHCGSQGHSVPIINGKTQVAGKDAFAENVTVDENGIKMNYEKAYREETLKTLYREFVFDKEKTEISIKDRFEFDKVPESVTERFVTRVKPEVCDGVINLETSKGKVSMKYDADKFDVTVIPNEVGDHMGKPFTYYSIDLCVKAPQKSMEFGFSIN